MAILAVPFSSLVLLYVPPLISNVTVSPNYFTIIYADTLLFYSIVIGGAVVLGGIIALIVFMVKKHRK